MSSHRHWKDVVDVFCNMEFIIHLCSPARQQHKNKQKGKMQTYIQHVQIQKARLNLDYTLGITDKILAV